MDLKKYIRSIQDYPKKGILFRDITTLIKDKHAFKECIDQMARTLINIDYDKIASIESRGFVFASPLAYNLDAFWSENKLSIKTEKVTKNLKYKQGIKDVNDAYAYVIDWNQRYAPKALSYLWSKGYKVRSARKEFNNGERSFSRGTLVVLMGRNLDKKTIIKLARIKLTSSWT